MYEFDFLRKRKTKITCLIDGVQHKIDNFPVPVTMNGQFCYYARYSNECELIEFANTQSNIIWEVEITNNQFKDGNTDYYFTDTGELSHVIVHVSNQEINIVFTPAVNLYQTYSGEFSIKPREQMGYTKGTYEVIAKPVLV